MEEMNEFINKKYLNDNYQEKKCITVNGVIYLYQLNGVTVYDIDDRYLLDSNINIEKEISGIPVRKIGKRFISKLSKKFKMLPKIKLPETIDEIEIELKDISIDPKLYELSSWESTYIKKEKDGTSNPEEQINKGLANLKLVENKIKYILSGVDIPKNKFILIDIGSIEKIIINMENEYSDYEKSKVGTCGQDFKQYNLELKDGTFFESMYERLNIFKDIIKLLYPSVDDLLVKCNNFFELRDNFFSLVNNGINIYLIVKHPDMINYSYDEMLENISKNYTYLVGQLSSRLSETNLQKILFDFECEGEKLDGKIISEKLNNGLLTILKLMRTPTEEMKQQLRDELVFISQSSVLTTENLSQSKFIKKVRRYFSRTIYENIVEEDQEIYKSKTSYYVDKVSRNGEDYLSGIHTFLNREITKINKEILNYYDKLQENEKLELLESLTTVKNWSLLSDDKKKRATRLKNEILGKLLYSIYKVEINRTNKPIDEINLQTINIDETFTKEVIKIFKSNAFSLTLNTAYQSDYAYKELEEKMEELNAKKQEKLKQQMLDIRIQYNPEVEIINKIITINPYFYDMLLDTPLENDIGIRKIAERKLYDFSNNNTSGNYSNFIINNYTEFVIQRMLNDIESGLFADSDKFLDNVKEQIYRYFNNQETSDENLFDIFRSVEVFLRNNSSILERNAVRSRVDKNTVLKFNNDLFDKTNQEYDNYDRMCYMLRMLNLLAHDENGFHMKKIEIDFNRYKNKPEIKKKELKSALDAYNYLSKYGLTPSEIDDILKYRGNAASLGIDENIEKRENKKQEQVDNFFERLKLNYKKITSTNLTEIMDELKLVLGVDEKIPNQETIKMIFSNIVMSNENNNTISKANFEKIIEDIKRMLGVDENQRKQKQIEKIKPYLNQNENNSEITLDNIEEIIENLRVISSMDGNIKKEIIEEVKAQQIFYDCKKIIAENLVRKVNERLNNITNNIVEDKIKFFKENGFIIEYQEDVQSIKGDDIIVVYNPKFNNSYSVHMNDVESDIRNVFMILKNDDSPKLAHVGTSIIYSGEKIKKTDLRKISAGYYGAKRNKNDSLPGMGENELIKYNGTKEDLNSVPVDYATRDDIKFHNFVEYNLEAMKLEYELIDKDNSEELLEFVKKLKDKIDNLIETPQNTTYEINGTKYGLYTFICNKIDSNNQRLFALFSIPYEKIEILNENKSTIKSTLQPELEGQITTRIGTIVPNEENFTAPQYTLTHKKEVEEMLAEIEENKDDTSDKTK